MPVGENPIYVKTSQQRRTKLCIYGGNKINEARGRDVSGRNVSECIEPRNY